jgi:probable HAF family extracellular repeat protein
LGLNDSDQVEGTTADSRAYFWSQGITTFLFDIGAAGQNSYDINNAGTVVGVVGPTLFTWQNGTFTYPPTLGGDSQGAQKINSAGNMAGYANPHPQSRFLAVWLNGGTTIQALAYSGGGYADGEGRIVINDLNHVAAFGIGIGTFLWKGGSTYVPIGDLGGGTTYPTAINNTDIIVGSSHNSSGQQRAFIWQDLNGNNQTDPGEMQDLNSFLPPNSGWVLDDAEGINDNGVIVGSGLLNGQRRAFVMSIATSPRSRTFLRLVVTPNQ